MNKIKNYMKNNWISLVILAVLFVGLYVVMLNNCLLDFDAGMNFQVSKSLADNGRYATNYMDVDYNASDSLLFDHKIQTGSPIIFPTALLNVIFGVKPMHMQIVLCAVYCVFLFLIYYVVSKRLGRIVGILTTLFFVPYTYFNPFYGYGEVAMGTVMLLTFLVFLYARQNGKFRYYFVTGLLFGIGYLTKTVFMICAPTYFLFLVYDLVKSSNRKHEFKKYLALVGGFLVPVAIFELYKLISLGGIMQYFSWWYQELACILTESGTSDEVGGITGLLSRIVTNIVWYGDMFNMLSLFLIVLMVFPAVYFIYCWKKGKKIDELNICLYFVFMTYMAWWLLIVSGDRLSERRIMIANVFGITNSLLLFGKIVKENFKKSRVMYSILTVAAAVIMGFIFVPKCISEYGGIVKSHERKQLIDEAVEFIRSQPENSSYYGSGWWQNPTIAVEANVTMHNIDCEELKPDSYFVEDVYMKVNSDTLNDMRSRYYVETVFENDECVICKISDDRDEKIAKKGDYIRIDAAMNYWGKITVDYGGGNSTKYNYNANIDHISVEAPNTDFTEVTITFDNYKGETTKINSIVYVNDGSNVQLAPSNKSELKVNIINEVGTSTEP